MKVLCAPDSFKETLTATRVAAAMKAGAERARPGVAAEACPVADGGEGSLEVLTAAMGGSRVDATVTGPRGEPVAAAFGVAAGGGTAVVELAAASGLALVPPARRDPEATTTFGTGELILAAARRGCTAVIVCLGGSATVDGGTGIAQALGTRFLDRDGRLIREPLTGGRLKEIAAWEPPPPGLPALRVACDVTNPLCGPRGAAAVYGPQKGATPEQVRALDEGLRRLATLAGVDGDRPGSGAAGGAAFGLAAFCGADLEPGIDLVLDAVRFRQRCAGVDLVLTGEGRLDTQTLHGKACLGVARAAADQGIRCVAIVGQVEGEPTAGSEPGGVRAAFAEVISLAERYGPERALRETEMLLGWEAGRAISH